MTKVEIIEETAKQYTTSTRAYDEASQSCEYVTSDGKRCAVGRCIKDDKVELVSERLGNHVVCSLNFLQIKQLFKPEYKGHGFNFWADLQELHDQRTYWNKSGLSDQGRVFYNLLLERYKDN